MTKELIKANINLQEHKDAYVTKKLLTRILKDKVQNLRFREMPKYSHFDLEVSFLYKGKNVKFAFEIKERNKSQFQLDAYPNSELKVDKFNYIMNATKNHDGVFYIQLVNEEIAYIYNLRKINWDNVETREWFIKTTQYNPNSGYKSQLTHFIPYSEGKKHGDIANYYAEYYLNHPEDKRYANN